MFEMKGKRINEEQPVATLNCCQLLCSEAYEASVLLYDCSFLMLKLLCVLEDSQNLLAFPDNFKDTTRIEDGWKFLES